MEKALIVTREKFGRLDVAVNCAGIGVAFKTYNFNKKLPHKLEDFVKVLTVSIFVCLKMYFYGVLYSIITIIEF